MIQIIHRISIKSQLQQRMYPIRIMAILRIQLLQGLTVKMEKIPRKKKIVRASKLEGLLLGKQREKVHLERSNRELTL